MPVQTVIHIKNLDKVIRNVSRLPISIARESKRFRKLYAEDWQKQLKLRAPVATGQLKDSIKVKPGKKDNEIMVTIDSPYGIFQGIGYTPHAVHESWTRGGGYTMGEWARAKGLPEQEWYWVKGGGQYEYLPVGSGFYARTELLMLKRLQKYGVAAVKQAIKDAGFKGG